MENNVVAMEYGTPREEKPKRQPKKMGCIERQEEYRARIIDSTVSIRENIERNRWNYNYY